MRRQPDRRPHVVAEDEERGAVGAQLATAPCRSRRRPWRARARRSGCCARRSGRAGRRPAPVEASTYVLVGRRQVGRAADEPRAALRQRVEHLAATTRAWPCPWRRRGTSGSALSQPSGSSRALHALELVGQVRVLLLVLGERLRPTPRAARRPRAPTPLLEVLAHPVGHQELRVLGPAVGRLAPLDLLCAQRLAVGSCVSCLFGAP